MALHIQSIHSIRINVLSITSTLFFIRMIKRVSMWQEARRGPSSLDMTLT